MGRKRVVKAPEERRRELMAAARELFVKVGYEKTSISDIVKHIGVAQGTFYWYFQSKDEILQAILREMLEHWLAVVEGLGARSDLGAIAKFQAIERAILELAFEHPDLMETLHVKANASVHDQVTAEALGRILPIIAAIIRQGEAEGTFQVENPEAAAFFLLTVVNGFFDQMTRGHGAGPDGVAPTGGNFTWPLPEPWHQLHRAMWAFVMRGLGLSGPLPID